jgi:hypothetical protein
MNSERVREIKGRLDTANLANPFRVVLKISLQVPQGSALPARNPGLEFGNAFGVTMRHFGEDSSLY